MAKRSIKAWELVGLDFLLVLSLLYLLFSLSHISYILDKTWLRLTDSRWHIFGKYGYDEEVLARIVHDPGQHKEAKNTALLVLNNWRNWYANPDKLPEIVGKNYIWHTDSKESRTKNQWRDRGRALEKITTQEGIIRSFELLIQGNCATTKCEYLMSQVVSRLDVSSPEKIAQAIYKEYLSRGRHDVQGISQVFRSLPQEVVGDIAKNIETYFSSGWYFVLDALPANKENLDILEGLVARGGKIAEKANGVLKGYEWTFMRSQKSN